jgi:hypothetical protein
VGPQEIKVKVDVARRQINKIFFIIRYILRMNKNKVKKPIIMPCQKEL